MHSCRRPRRELPHERAKERADQLPDDHISSDSSDPSDHRTRSLRALWSSCLESLATFQRLSLELPAFLVDGGDASARDLTAAFRLTGHFLDAHVWSARPVDPPAMREALVEALTG